MSFGLNKPSDPAAPNTVRAAAARRAAANPAFRPEFARSLRMHPAAAAVVAALVLTLLFAYALHARPSYEAESLIYVEPAAIKALSAEAGIFDAVKYDTYIQQQILTASRLDILVAALQTLPRTTWQPWGPTLQAAATRLQNSVKIQRAGTSYQLSFTLAGTDPVKTADTLNAIVKTYLATGRKDELAQSDLRTRILLEERQRIQNELAAGKAEQAQLSSLLGMANPALDAGNAYDEQLAGLRSQIAGARENHEIAAAQLAAVSGPDAAHLSGLTAAADDSINTDPGLSSMRSSVGQRRATLTGQMAGLTPENPVFKQDQEELGDLDRQLAAATQTARDQAARRLGDKLRTDLARTGDIEARLNAQLAQQVATATSASPRLQRAAELNADLHRLMARFASVDDSLRTLQLDASGPGLAHLALAATPPPFPVPSRVRLLLVAALPLALLSGLFAAVFARQRDAHIYTGPDLESVLGFTPIAVLPAAADVSANVLREYMLRLAAGIEGAYRGGNARTFVVTAAGATTDIPALTAALELRLEALGLDTTSVTAAQILNPSPDPNPDPSPEPATPNHVTLEPHRTLKGRHEGFAAGRLDLLKAAHDLIFIQAPAILTSAETEYVVRLADATILVAESGITTRGDLLQAALLLERLNAHGIGAVLDNLALRDADPAYLKALRLLERRQATEPGAATPRPRTAPNQVQTAAPEPVSAMPAPEPDAPHASLPSFSSEPNEESDASQTSHEGSSTSCFEPNAAPAAQPVPAAAPQSTPRDLLPLAPFEAKPIAPTPSHAEAAAAPAFVPEIVELPLAEIPQPPTEAAAQAPAQPIAQPEPHPPEPAIPEAQAPGLNVQAESEPVMPEPVMPEPVTPEPVNSEPVISEPVIREPVLQAQSEPVVPLEPAPAEIFFEPQPPLHAAPILESLQESSRAASDALESLPVSPETSLSFRTARMDAEPARRNSGPWRDRRVAGSDTHIDPLQDRRFNWAAREAEAAARNAPPLVEARHAPVPAPPARPHLVPREASLTRNWRLLSRYQGAPDDLQDESDDARTYRRG